MKEVIKRLIILCIFTLALSNSVLAAGDNTAPVILDFDVSPTVFSTDSGDVVLTATMHITDATGVWAVGDAGGPVDTLGGTLTFMNDYNESGMIDNFIRTSGTATDGIYTVDLIIPKYSSSGDWHLSYLNFRDIDDNIVSYSKAEFQAAVPGATGLEFNNTGAAVDVTGPQITEFSITPVSFDTESSSATLDLTMRVTDAGSGIWVAGDIGNPIDNFNISVESRTTDQTEFFTGYTRTSGNQNDGIYTAQVVIPLGSATGNWDMPYARVTDRWGNFTSYSNSELLAAVPAATGLNLTNTAETALVNVDFEWTLTYGNHEVIIPANTDISKNGGGTFDLLQFDLIDFDLATKPAIDSFVTKFRLGISGINLDFSDYANFSAYAGSENDGKTLNVMGLKEGELAWTNIGTCVVVSGVCEFTYDHSSYFVLVEQPAEEIITPPVVTASPFANSELAFSKKEVKSGKTSKKKVKLLFKNIENASSFMISKKSDFSDAQWQTTSTGVSIKFGDSKAKRKYYVKFKDANGVESPILSKSISYQPETQIIKQSKSKIKNGEVLVQEGKKFKKNSEVMLFFSKKDGSYYPPVTIKADAYGSFKINFKVNKEKGKYYWYAKDKLSGKASKKIPYTVI